MGGWADDRSRTRRARHGVAPRRAVSATSAAGTAPTSAVRWSRERRALPFEHARDVGRRKHLQSSAAQPSRSDRSQRSRAARDIPCRAGFNHDAVRDIPCHMGYGYAPPCGGRGIRRRGGHGSDAVRDMLFLAAEAVELELLAVRQHVRVEELLEPMPQRHARLHARCSCAPPRMLISPQRCVSARHRRGFAATPAGCVSASDRDTGSARLRPSSEPRSPDSIGHFRAHSPFVRLSLWPQRSVDEGHLPLRPQRSIACPTGHAEPIGRPLQALACPRAPSTHRTLSRGRRRA